MGSLECYWLCSWQALEQRLLWNDPKFQEPDIHIPNLNNLDVVTDRFIFLDDTQLVEKPVDCSHSKFELILRQFRHLHTHMGMIMGFIIEATGQWPTVLGLETPIPMDNNCSKFC